MKYLTEELKPSEPLPTTNFHVLGEIFSPNCLLVYKLLTCSNFVNTLFDSLLKKYFENSE